MPSANPTGDEGLEGLDDALGDIINRKTNAQKKQVEQHDAAIVALKDEIERLKRQLEECVDRDTYLRESTQLKAESSEASTLAREARSQLSAMGPQLRDDLLKLIRDELATGLAASHKLATTHDNAISDLHTAASGADGRLAAVELQTRSIEESQRARSSDIEERLADFSGAQEVKSEEMRRELAAAQASVQRMSETVDASKAEQDLLRRQLEAEKRKAMEVEEVHARQIETFKLGYESLQGILTEYLGVEPPNLSALMQQVPQQLPLVHAQPEVGGGGSGGSGGGGGSDCGGGSGRWAADSGDRRADHRRRPTDRPTDRPTNDRDAG